MITPKERVALLERLHEDLLALGFEVERKGDELHLNDQAENSFRIGFDGRVIRSALSSPNFSRENTVDAQLYWCAKWQRDSVRDLAESLG